MPSRWNLSGTETACGGTRYPSSHRLVEAIGVGRHAVLEVEQIVGVAVDLVLRRGGQADQQAVEIVEDRPVLLVDGAVRLIDDDKVEMARRRSGGPRRASRRSSPIMVG